MVAAAISVGNLALATPTQASACDYYLSRYEALMAEAVANSDADLAVRAQYWYQDYEACLAREAANPPRTPSGGSSSGSSGGSTWTPTRPSYIPPPPTHLRVGPQLNGKGLPN